MTPRRPLSANPLRPQVEGIPSEAQQRAMMLTDLRTWGDRFHRSDPCGSCFWPFPHYGHLHHGEDTPTLISGEPT